MKKNWKKPELVVLVRGNTEEAVLSLCKGAGPAGGSNLNFTGCHKAVGCAWGCNTIAAS